MRGNTASRAEMRRDEKGQSLILVIGLVTMISLGGYIMAQNVSQHYPIVLQDQLEHEAYRAMQAGINEYLSVVNDNPDAVMCGATVDTVSNYPNPTSSTTATPSLPTSLCSGLTAGSWITVPNLGTTKGPNAWYLYGSPTVYYCTGSTSSCPDTVWVSMKVIGAAGGASQTSYNPGTVSFVPANGFLLNLWWLNYDQEDPTTVAGTQSCTYYWPSNSVASSCVPVDFVGGESLTGNIFSNDAIFICSSSSDSSGSPTVNGTIESHYPDDSSGSSGSPVVTDPDSNCSDGDNIDGTKTLVGNAPVEPLPTDDVELQTEAAESGCVYEGPTEISFGVDPNITASSTNNQAYYMDVYSPDTQTTARTSGGTTTYSDNLNDSGNSSTCMSSSTGGWVPYPSNGVVYVENCQTGASCTSYDPLNSTSGDLFSPDDGISGWTGPSASSTSSAMTEGDALVQGTTRGPITVATQNNIVITGNLCYASWGTLSPTSGVNSGNTYSCSSPPSTISSADVLGLIAYNYVIVNHPVTTTTSNGYGGNGGFGGNGGGQTTTYTNDSNCTNNLAPFGAGTTPACDLSNPVIDAAILALNQQFFVMNWGYASAIGSSPNQITINGSIGEDWRGPVGTGGSSGTPSTGYSKNYTYDNRLAYLSPPLYLNPGTSTWSLGVISAGTGSCPSTVSGCSTTP
jgi:hypothetical protein